MSNYARKPDLKGVTEIDTSKFSEKTDLANLKWDVDNVHIDKLKTVFFYLRKLSNVLKRLYMINWLKKLIISF